MKVRVSHVDFRQRRIDFLPCADERRAAKRVRSGGRRKEGAR
jgi:hypothetical protein